MTSSFNYIQKTRNSLTVGNSLLNVLPYNVKKFQNKQLKIHNIIRGTYKDKILKDSIYISSNNLKKDFFLRKQELKLFHNNSSYLSYLKNSSDNIYNQFNQIYKVYRKNFYKHFYYKQYYFKYFSTKKIKFKRKVLTKMGVIQTLFWKQRYSLSLKTKYDYNNLVLINNNFTNNFLNQNGILLKFRPRMFTYSVYTGLINIVPNSGQIYFRKVLSLPYLCLQFKKKLSTSKNPLSLYCVLYIYIMFYKYNLYKFRKCLVKNKISIRKINPFLVNYEKKFERLQTKLVNIIKYYNSSFSITNLKDTSLLTIDKKIKIFQKLTFNIYLNSNFKPIDKIDNYFYYKSLLNNQILNTLIKDLIFNSVFFYPISKLNSFYSYEFGAKIISFITDIVKIQRTNSKKKRRIFCFGKDLHTFSINLLEELINRKSKMPPKWWLRKMEKKKRPKNRRTKLKRKYA